MRIDRPVELMLGPCQSHSLQWQYRVYELCGALIDSLLEVPRSTWQWPESQRHLSMEQNTNTCDYNKSDQQFHTSR
jgi:hypothetical protein